MSGIEHGVEEAVKGFLVAGQYFVIGGRAFFGKIQAEHAAHILCRESYAVLPGGSNQTVAQCLGFCG